MNPNNTGMDIYLPLNPKAGATPIITRGITDIIVIGWIKDLNCGTNTKYTNITDNINEKIISFMDSLSSS